MTTFTTEDREAATQKPHIFIATPMYGGMCAGFYTQSLLLLQKKLNAQNIDVSFSFMFNESLITRARNSMAKGFLKSEPKATHLMFIDADIRFNPDDVPRMIEVDKEIICGIYPKKEINWDTVKRAMDNGVPNENLKYHTGSFVVNLVDYSGSVTVPVNEPVEIWNGGTGFMLIKREVFEKLADKVPSYMNNVLDLAGTIKAEPIKEYFTTSIEEESNILLSEDYHFCKLARTHGIKVWAAPWVTLGHMGSYLFEGQLLPAP
ncbi:dpG-synthase-like protein [Bacteriophage sp.]|nr:dpG-synthase-like protein [Bacteriophage sp.]